MNRWTVTLCIAALTAPLAAQEEKVETRVVVRDDAKGEVDIKAVLVDKEGKAKVVPFGDGSGFAWVPGGRGGHGVRYLDFGGHRRFIGVQLMSLTPELREHFGVDGETGVMVSKVFADTPAERAGIEVGDIITTAGNRSIETSGDLSRAIADLDEGESVSIELNRDGRQQALEVDVEQRSRNLVDMTPRLLGRRAVILGGNGPDREKLEKLRQDYTLALPGMQSLHLGRYEELEEMLERLDDYFESDEWQDRLEHLEATDWGDVEERMKAVEERLRELEGNLEKRR